ncbi:MAG: hypothetical protein KJ070_19500 [Verrucomicrobia bacterium]|nr:hypothetical protein [Verrucomicrobiota bacterium]
MLGEAELETVRLRKELLVLKSDTARLRLLSELQRASKPEHWLNEASQAARRHPVLTAGLGVGLGVVALQSLRHPVATLGWLGRLGGLGSTVFSAWKLFNKK